MLVYIRVDLLNRLALSLMGKRVKNWIAFSCKFSELGTITRYSFFFFFFFCAILFVFGSCCFFVVVVVD